MGCCCQGRTRLQHSILGIPSDELACVKVRLASSVTVTCKPTNPSENDVGPLETVTPETKHQITLEAVETLAAYLITEPLDLEARTQ